MELGLTQQELAELVEVTRQTITLIEKETYNPTIKLCLKISSALKKDLNTLFGGYYNEAKRDN